MNPRLFFASDYQEGAHPAILEALAAENLIPHAGYGTDPVSEEARALIRDACSCPGAAVHFLVGGTQMNAAVIRAALRPWQGVLAADSGHIAQHEAGAIEAGGHKVLTLPGECGKLRVPMCVPSVSASSQTPIMIIWSNRGWSTFPSRRSTGPSIPKRS